MWDDETALLKLKDEEEAETGDIKFIYKITRVDNFKYLGI